MGEISEFEEIVGRSPTISSNSETFPPWLSSYLWEFKQQSLKLQADLSINAIFARKAPAAK